MDIAKELEQIRKDLAEKSTEIPPLLLADYLNKLSVWIATLSVQVAEAETKFANVKEEYIGVHPDTSMARVNNLAKTKKEYLELEKVKALNRSVIESIRSIKKLMRLQEGEKETSVNL